MIPASGAHRPLLSVEGLTLDLVGGARQRGIVQDLSFSIEAGRSTALIGESGCGKTLTSRAVLRLLPAGVRISSGAIWFDGKDLVRCSEPELRRLRGAAIGLVSQEPMVSLNPTMTVGDQIGEARRIHLGESRAVARRHAVDLLARVGISEPAKRAHAYPHELSGGMQQRVVIAAAIACGPKLLIADEPTTALDVTVQAEILELLHELQTELGMAVLLVTHDLGVVAGFCDDVVVMYAGHGVERANVAQIFAEPQHPYTSALLASVPQSGRSRERLATIPGRVPAAGSLPRGCRFSTRCPHVEPDVCLEHQDEGEARPGHYVRCGRVLGGQLIAGVRA